MPNFAVSSSVIGDVSRFYDLDLITRVMAACEPEPNTGCWFLTLAPDGEGYAVIKWQRKTYKAHRVMAGLQFSGPHIQVDHLCGNKSCCNPEHLSVTDARSHTRRHRGWVDPQSGICRQGHDITITGAYFPAGKFASQLCAVCVQEKNRRSAARPLTPEQAEQARKRSREYRLARLKSDPVWAESVRMRARLRRMSHREEMRAKYKVWYQANKERINAKKRVKRSGGDEDGFGRA